MRRIFYIKKQGGAVSLDGGDWNQAWSGGFKFLVEYHGRSDYDVVKSALDRGNPIDLVICKNHKLHHTARESIRKLLRSHETNMRPEESQKVKSEKSLQRHIDVSTVTMEEMNAVPKDEYIDLLHQCRLLGGVACFLAVVVAALLIFG